jgi:cell division septation protein DedD
MPTTDTAIDRKQGESLREESSHNVSPQRADSQREAALRSRRDSKPLRGLLFGFAATVTIGLALASWYVGVRIVSADEVTSSNIPAVVPPAAATPATGVTSDSIAQAYFVPPTELYLHAAGLGSKRDAIFVKSLRTKGFHAKIETLDEALANVLIGPFSSKAELEQGQRALESEGILAVETPN